MPTGFGKSAVYQIAGVLVPGPTVVVSPLIALQRDQVDSLEERGLTARELNSTLSDSRRADALEAVSSGRVEFLFLAPEQLANGDTLAAVKRLRPSLLVVDEAHCVSEWGHDFRPEYLRLGAFAQELGRPRVLALTAMAAPPVRAEIVERLGLRDPEVVVRGFDRPNIRLAVERFHDEDTKREALLDRVDAATRPGIVYAATRRRAEELAEALEARGLRVRPYHAGLKASERGEAQEAFMGDGLDAIVSTVAFGMGIERRTSASSSTRTSPTPSTRTTRSSAAPPRRRARGRGALLPSRGRGLRRFFAGSAPLDSDELKVVVEAVAESEEPVSTDEVAEEEGVSAAAAGAGVRRLADVGALEILSTGELAAGPRRTIPTAPRARPCAPTSAARSGSAPVWR